MNDNDLVSQKLFQRKRRIEIHVSHPIAKRNNLSPTMTGENVDKIEHSINNHQMPSGGDKSSYSNFQKGGTEFVDKQSTDEAAKLDSETVDKQLDEIKEELTVLEPKLAFLCEGKGDISPVQIMQIQLQVSLFG